MSLILNVPERTRRPSSQIEAITLSNTLDEENQWIPLTIVKGSWILLQNRKRKRTISNEFLYHWKARVIAFRLKDNRQTVKEVLVQHVFMHKELNLTNRPVDLPRYRPNCKSKNDF